MIILIITPNMWTMLKALESVSSNYTQQQKPNSGSMRTSVSPIPNLSLPRVLITDFLRSNNSGSKIRFITDNVRLEREQNRRPSLNSNGGEALLRFVRGRRLSDTPVLVFCSNSIRYTKYVREFELAGS